VRRSLRARRALSTERSSRPAPDIGWREVAYFLAEVVVYVLVVWWSLALQGPLLLRLLLAIGLFAAFAITWGLLVSPKAKWPLRGRADTAFRIVWFGLGLAAGTLLILGK